MRSGTREQLPVPGGDRSAREERHAARVVEGRPSAVRDVGPGREGQEAEGYIRN